MVAAVDHNIRTSMALLPRGETLVDDAFWHHPVLLLETVRYLAVRPGAVYIDCTVGEGGHASAVLQAAMPGGRLLGIDLDPAALSGTRRRLSQYEGSYTEARGSYSQLRDIAFALDFVGVDGVLMDLGLSSLQLQASGRGFSFQNDEPLDMRFNPDGSLTAGHIVNSYPADRLASILSRFGEERRSRAIARAIAQSRPIQSTRQLAELIEALSGGRRGRVHPATRTFQALRIAVNSELDNLPAGLEQAIGTLKPGGRLVVISYHSLEDRIAKETMAREARDCICPPAVPVCICGHVASLKLVSRRVITPSQEEVRVNPRSRSARLRVAERLPHS